MGRKIPAKKHKGVKDPLKQQAQRMLILKSKINAPPKDPDDQPVPRSVTQLFAFKNQRIKKPKTKKKKKLLHHTEEKYSRNPLSKLKKIPGESGRSFSLRINNAIKTLNTDINEQGYPLDHDDDDNDHKGEQMAFHRERRERKRKRAAVNKKDDTGEEKLKLTRGQKLTLKKKAKKEKIAEKSTNPEVTYDHVGFGDIVHAPPSLTIKPRKAQIEDGAPRPGRRGLLLNKLLTNDNSVSKVTGGVGKKKQKDLPVAEQLRRERARLDAVAAYRALKLNKPNKES